MADAERERYTPSMNTPTDGSMPALFAPLPKPRMMKLVLAELCSWVTRNVGAKVCRSLKSRTCAFSMSSALVTVTATGISCSVCSRLVAVTMISFSSTSSSAAALASCANAGVLSASDAKLAVDNMTALIMRLVVFIFLSCKSSNMPIFWLFLGKITGTAQTDSLRFLE